MNGKRMMIGVVLITALLTPGCTNKGVQKTTQEEKVIAVGVQAVMREDLENKMLYGGQVKPSEQIMVMSKVPGKVKEVFFDIGDTVRAGDILFRLDEKDIQNNIKALESQVAASQTNVNSARTGVNSARGSQIQAQINQAEANVRRTELTLQDTQRGYEDVVSLYEAGSASKQQHDQAESAYKQAQLSYDAAQQAYELLINKTTKETVQGAEDRLSQAIASKNTLLVQLNNAKESMKDTAIRSPINGIVSSRTVDPGEMVGSANIPFAIVQMETVLVHVNISEQLINKVAQGQMVQVLVKAAGELPFTGKIKAVSPAADERTAGYPVKIEISNENKILKPGMFAEIQFSLEKREQVITVPRSALLTENQQEYVYIVEEDVAKRVLVKTGLDTGEQIEIREGLTEGQMLIIKGQQYVQDGMKVQPTSKAGGQSS